MKIEASAIEAGEASRLVRSKRVFRTNDWILFSLLSFLRIGALIWFFYDWLLPTSWWTHEILIFAGAALLLFLAQLGNLIRWVALPAMRSPAPLEPWLGLRVAAVTTCVPNVEPQSM